jgi:DNA-binding MarR family transcriptional regulator
MRTVPPTFLDQSTPDARGSVKMLDDQPKKRLGAVLSQAQDSWQSALQSALEKRDLPVLGAGADLLVHLTLEGISQSLLPERLGLSKQAVQQSLDQLERQNLVRREIDPGDKRARRVLLTETGLYVLEARRDAESEIEKQFRDLLGKKAFGKLRKSLKTLSAARASTRE